MAGSYADVPNNRMAYDEDGSIAVYVDPGGGVSVYGQGTIDALNSDTGGAGIGAPFNAVRWVGVIFPEQRDISGLYVRYSYQWDGAIWSPNTTTGVDGTWSSFSFSPYDGGPVPGYRTDIRAVSLTGVKGIRFGQHDWSYNSYLHNIHVYGRPTVATGVDRLQIWHPTLDQRVTGSYFDFGDVSRGTTTDKQFRVKNISDTLTANNVTLSVDTLSDTTPSVPGMHYFSNGGSYVASLNIGALYPGQISGLLTFRQVLPVNAQLALWAVRIKAIPGSWT